MYRRIKKFGVVAVLINLICCINVFGSSDVVCSDSPNLYLGEVFEKDGVIEYCVFIENKDTLPITISKFEATHTGLKAKTEKNKLLPGEKSAIKVFFNPIGTSSIFRDVLNIYAGDTKLYTFNVSAIILEGSLKDAVRYSVGTVGMKSSQINFGFVFKGQVAKRMVPIINQSDENVKIELGNIPSHIDVLVNPIKLAAGESGYLELNYNSSEVNNWDIDMHSIQMTVEGKNVSKKNISVVANVRENFELLSEEEKAAIPKAEFPDNIYQFDTISSGQLVEHPFILKNEGNRDLIIRTIRPACGFAEVSPNKGTIPPGETAIINAIFDSKGISGFSKRGITIVTNDPENYKQFLWVQGYVQ